MTDCPFFSHNCSLTETMPRKIQGSGQSRFRGFEKGCDFLKIPKWHHKCSEIQARES